MKRLIVIMPWLAIASAITVIVALGFGGPVPRWIMFVWPAVVIVWSSVVLMQNRTMKRNQETIELQANVIQKDAELLTHFLQY